VTDKQLEASRIVEAPPDKIFALLTTPDRHPELDASGAVRGSRTHHPLSAVGDVFEMEMHGEDMGDYVVDNHVVTFEPDREIAWAPATHGGDRGGQVWTYRLEPRDSGGGTLVNINTASATELETLSGVGEVIAAAIVDYRTQNGPFTSVDQLEDVSGIGPATMEEIRDSVTV